MITKEQRLEQLARYYGSDIVEHNYIPHIAKYLPEKIFSLLEVGVLNGASARMFDDFYDNEPEIHLIDLFAEHGHMTPRQARKLGFVPFVGSQSDVELLRSLPTAYEIISEDASHNCHDQLITFKELFWGKLRQGGVYFLQDAHTSKDEFYYGGLVKSFYHTPLYMFKHFLATGGIVNPYFTPEDSEVFKKLIDTVEICADEKLIVIKRK
jgi:hypothetical protein